MKTISFDFDDTIWSQDNGFLWDTVDLMKLHVTKGDRVIVVTARIDKWIPECHKLLKIVGLQIDVFSAPGHPDWDQLITKSDVLLDHKAECHYDDMPEWGGLKKAKDQGVSILPPPGYFYAKMY